MTTNQDRNRSVLTVQALFYDYAVYDWDLAWAITNLLDCLTLFGDINTAMNAWQELCCKHDARMLRAKVLTEHYKSPNMDL